MRKDTEHVSHKGSHFISLALVFFIDFLQFRNHVCNGIETSRQDLLLFLQFRHQLRYIIERALAFGAVLGALKNNLGFFIGQEDMPSSRDGRECLEARMNRLDYEKIETRHARTIKKSLTHLRVEGRHDRRLESSRRQQEAEEECTFLKHSYLRKHARF
jgi:hypothetical protein